MMVITIKDSRFRALERSGHCVGLVGSSLDTKGSVCAVAERIAGEPRSSSKPLTVKHSDGSAALFDQTAACQSHQLVLCGKPFDSQEIGLEEAVRRFTFESTLMIR